MTSRQHIVLGGLGRVRRAALSQPPHFRRGRDNAPFIDTVAIEAIRALAITDNERNAYYRSTGVRAITT